MGANSGKTSFHKLESKRISLFTKKLIEKYQISKSRLDSFLPSLPTPMARTNGKRDAKRAVPACVFAWNHGRPHGDAKRAFASPWKLRLRSKNFWKT